MRTAATDLAIAISRLAAKAITTVNMLRLAAPALLRDGGQRLQRGSRRIRIRHDRTIPSATVLTRAQRLTGSCQVAASPRPAGRSRLDRCREATRPGPSAPSSARPSPSSPSARPSGSPDSPPPHRPPPRATPSATPTRGRPPPGPRADAATGRGRDGGALAAQLADKLGVDQAKVESALRAFRDEHKPRPSPPPGRPRRGPTGPADDAALAKALAGKLGVDEAKVKTALDEIRAARQADRAAALKTRLDAAVKAGTLTQAEADAVQKAVDKGVIDVRAR